MENHDRIIHFTLGAGAVRGLFIQSTETVREAQRVHAASALGTAVLGRALTGTSMLGALLKEPKASVTMTIDGGGPAGKVLCVGDGQTVRGWVINPHVSLPLREDKLDVGTAVGRKGRLSVVKDMRLKTPYIGQIALKSGEIAADLAYYYVQSEQSPSLVSLGVIASDTEVASAGGLLLQPMPGCPDGMIDQLEMRSPIFGDVAGELQHDSPQALIDLWFSGLTPVVLEESPLSYQCHCSRERMERALISLGEQELKRMIADEVEGAELVCHFCNKKYHFSTHDLTRLLSRIR